jgi:hypothetical protein
MDTQNSILAGEISFKDFVLKNRTNKIILWLAMGAIIVQFGIFKYLYPFASYIHGDSFSYIKAAYQNLDINTYPIGYSRFLRLFSVFTKSDTALVAFQYLFLQTSMLFLLFTTFYFYKPGRITQFLLLAFMVFNPLFLHLANLISSDGLFVALSLTWFALLLWIVHRPSTKNIIWHTMLLLLAFVVRYNAIVYPLISTVAFWLSTSSIKNKIIGVLASVLLCGSFICLTSYQYKKLTGYWQFSPFSGWLMTNNAMYAYRYVKRNDRMPVPKKLQVLDNMIREYFDSTRDTKRFPAENLQASTVYMWTPTMSLIKYRNILFKNDTAATEFKKWASMGPFYKEYGIHIITRYPWHFLRYFIWPNAKKYYAPPVEFLDTYNSGKNYVKPEAQKWFDYKNEKVKTRMKNNAVWILNYYPILSGIVNVLLLCFLLYYLILKGWTFNTPFIKCMLIGSSFWLINAVFTITVSSAALRFQSFPMFLTVTLVLLLIDWMVQLMKSIQKKEAFSKDNGNIQSELVSNALG